MRGYTGTLVLTGLMAVASAGATVECHLGGTINFAGANFFLQSELAGGRLTFYSHGIAVSAISCNSNAGYLGTIVFADNVTATALTLTASVLHLDGPTHNAQLAHSFGSFSSAAGGAKTLNLGLATITITGTGTSWNIGSAPALSATGSTIMLTGATAVFGGGGLAYGTLAMTGAGIATLSGFNSFVNLTRTGTAAKTDSFSIGGDQTISGVLTISGNSPIARLLVASNTVATPRTITVNGSIAASNVDLRDITGAGSASWNFAAISGLSGDSGGNTGITFTAPGTSYWKTATTGSKNYSDANWFLASNGAGGVARVPLPQDSAIFDAASLSGATTLAFDMPRIGGFDATAITQALTLGSATVNVHRSWRLSTLVPNFNIALIFSGRATHGSGSFGINYAGRTNAGAVVITAPTGVYTLEANMIGTGAWTLTAGALDAATFNIQATTFASAAGSGIRTLQMGSGTWTLAGTGNVWNFSAGGTLTFPANTATIRLTDISATAKNFAGAGVTYYDLIITGGGTGAVNITGSNTFRNITVGAPKTVTLTASTTQTITGAFSATGSVGNLITINSATPGTRAALSKASGIVGCDYLRLQDNNAIGGALWYAGVNSSELVGGSTSGWTFAGAPQMVTATAVLSVAALGLPHLTTRRTLSPLSVGSTAALGAPHLTRYYALRALGIGSASALGAPSMTKRYNLRALGVGSGTAVGLASMTQLFVLSPLGVQSLSALGAPHLVRALRALGVESVAALGFPSARPRYAGSPIGVRSVAGLGAPHLLLILRPVFEDTLRAILAGTKLFGERVYLMRAPQQPPTIAVPYAVFFMVAPYPHPRMTGPLGMLERDYQISIFDRSQSNALGVADILRARLDTLHGVVGSMRIDSTFYQTQTWGYEDDTGLYQIVQEYRFQFTDLGSSQTAAAALNQRKAINV
jgi:hypothetical protein